MSGSNGIVVLADTTEAVDPATGRRELVDLVGYGDAASSRAARAAPALSSTTSATRDAAAHRHRRQRRRPHRRRARPAEQRGRRRSDEPPAPAAELTIAEIQGSGAASPVAGQTVTTPAS